MALPLLLALRTDLFRNFSPRRTYKRGTAKGNLFAMISGAILNAILLYLIRTTNFPLGWSWLILIGTAWTFCVGSLFKE